MAAELAAGVKYVILTDKGMEREEVLLSLTRSNFSLDWIEQNQVLIVEAIEDEVLNVDEAIELIGSALKDKLGLDDLNEEIFKAYVDDPANEDEGSNFVAAFHEGLELKGRHEFVRHVRVHDGVRLSETLTVLQGLFTKSLAVVVKEMYDYLLANGFTEDELDNLMAMDGDLLLPPVKTGDVMNQFINQRRAADAVGRMA